MDYQTLLKESIGWLFGEKAPGPHPVVKAKKAMKDGALTKEERDALFPFFKASLKNSTDGKIFCSEFEYKDALSAAGFDWDGKAWSKSLAPGMEIPEGPIYKVWFALL